MDNLETDNVLPPWADADLSCRLPGLAAGGERQDLEMKERFPEQARDLAKEIAAFATSNAGMILVGVSDDGDFIGLPDCWSTFGRTQLLGRIEGICANSIKPTITPICRFGVVDGLILLAVEIPKGAAPLYYVGNVPYLRQLTASRPAEPQEVIDCILAWHRSRNLETEKSPESQFLSLVASLVTDVVVHAGEVDERQINPWLDELRSNLARLGQRAREFALEAPAKLSEMSESLDALANELENVAYQQLSIGSGWDEMQAAANAAIREARKIKRRWIDIHELDESSVTGLRETIAATARKLTGLASRVDQMDEQNRLQEIQSEAAEHGLILLRAAAFGIGLGNETSLNTLAAIGRKLREVETRTMYMDGGQSVQRILDDVRNASEELNSWLEQLSVHEARKLGAQ